MARSFSPYELTHLARHGFSQAEISQLETTSDPELPVEYLSGRVEFFDHTFQVSPATMIPREETEELVQKAILIAKKLSQYHAPLRCIDVGTGSGAIGISTALALAQRDIDLHFILSDISPAALRVTQQNLDVLVPTALRSRMQLRQSDLLSDTYGQFDLILANLPYIPQHLLRSLDESVKEFEPHISLSGGDAGLELIQRLLVQAKRKLAHDGWLLLEVDSTHRPEILMPLARTFGYELHLRKDRYARWRFALLQHQR
jgi:release factor glutamine methyltransferase